MSSHNDLDCNYGGIAEACGLSGSRRLSVRGIEKATLGLTEVKWDHADFGETGPIPYSDAISVGVHLRPLPRHELSFDGCVREILDVKPGDSIFYDLRRNPRAYVTDRFHTLHFVFTRDFMSEVARDLNFSGIVEIRQPPGTKIRDRVVSGIGRRALSFLQQPGVVTDLYGSHLVIALGVHVATTYGGIEDRNPMPKQAIDSRQIRIAQELMLAHLDGGIDLRSLAAACHLPPHLFAVAFRKSVGLSPYQWLQAQRILAARTLIIRSSRPFQTVAALAGFHDEQHLEHVFTSAFGVPPASYRKGFQ